MKAIEVSDHLEGVAKDINEASKTSDWQAILHLILPVLYYISTFPIPFVIPKKWKAGITALLFALDEIDESGNYKKRQKKPDQQ